MIIFAKTLFLITLLQQEEVAAKFDSIENYTNHQQHTTANIPPIIIQKPNQQVSREFNYQQFIAPTALLITGIIGVESRAIIQVNQGVKSQLQKPTLLKTKVDDYIQYMPAISIFALDALGLPAAHTLKERLELSTMAHLIMGITVTTIKQTGTVMRPDGSKRNSFPSGHTSLAFVGAELLWQEYHQHSPWIGVAGYLVAGTTGFLRMYNNRHWLTDVLAGAGIGILSTKLAYFLHPYIFSYNNSKFRQLTFYPIKNNEGIQLAAQFRF